MTGSVKIPAPIIPKRLLLEHVEYRNQGSMPYPSFMLNVVVKVMYVGVLFQNKAVCFIA